MRIFPRKFVLFLQYVSSINRNNILQQVMGVCIGACAKVEKMAPEMNNNQKNQIENNLKTDAFQTEQCNYKTTENEQFVQEKQDKKQSGQPVQAKNQGDAENQDKKTEVNVGSGDKNGIEIQQETFRNRKIDDTNTNLLNRGKANKDNTLIQSTMKGEQITKLGSIQLDNGITYQGQWKNAMRQGQGTQTWADGSKYVGEWKNNKANGKGILYHSDGDVYEGEWLNDKANGQGTYTHSNGAKYVGEWKDDKQNGIGVEEWLDGQRYEGQYKNGTKTGKGVLKFLDSSYYEGEFFNNQIHGKGVYVWCKNRKYEGEWQNNKMHGLGKTEWTDGRKYEGQYVNDKKHGQGTFYWPDGRKYQGSWKDGKQHGRGEYVLISGQKKLGEWVDGKRIKWLDQAPKLS